MENIRIQDDLYMHVNGETIENLVIPDDKPYAGGFAELSDGVEKIMMEEFASMSESKSNCLDCGSCRLDRHRNNTSFRLN